MSRDPKLGEHEVHDTLEMSRAELDELIRKSAADAREVDSTFDLASEELADD